MQPVLIGALAGSVSVVLSGLFLQTSGPPVQQEIPTRIVAEFDTVAVPVPVEYVPAGSRISDIQFEHMTYPVHQVPQGAILALDGFENAMTLTSLPARLPLFPQNLDSDGAPGNPVIDRIPTGMRAITIRVDATTVVEGWAGSGAIIDVLLVESDKTSVVAEQVKILSAERSVQPVAGSIEPAVPSTVTLLVTQEQALAINTATPRGRITFALRSFQDETNWKDRVYTTDRISRTGVTATPATVQGYISVKNERQYALTDGKWIPTEVRPAGFLVRTQQRD
jgi:Flp pilus assembly protein CpaB